jgi:hypothetical protein
VTVLDVVVVGLAFLTAVYNVAGTRSLLQPLRQFVNSGSEYKASVELLTDSFEYAVQSHNVNVTQTLETMKSQTELLNETVRESIQALDKTVDRITRVMGNLIDKLP